MVRRQCRGRAHRSMARGTLLISRASSAARYSRVSIIADGTNYYILVRLQRFPLRIANARIVSGDRPHQCTLCDFKSNRRDKLTVHLRRRHGIQSVTTQRQQPVDASLQARKSHKVQALILIMLQCDLLQKKSTFTNASAPPTQVHAQQPIMNIDQQHLAMLQATGLLQQPFPRNSYQQ